MYNVLKQAIFYPFLNLPENSGIFYSIDRLPNPYRFAFRRLFIFQLETFQRQSNGGSIFRGTVFVDQSAYMGKMNRQPETDRQLENIACKLDRA